MNPLILYDVFPTFYHFYRTWNREYFFWNSKMGVPDHASIYFLYIQIDKLTYRFTPDIFLYIVMVSTHMAMF